MSAMRGRSWVPRISKTLGQGDHARAGVDEEGRVGVLEHAVDDQARGRQVDADAHDVGAAAALQVDLHRGGGRHVLADVG
jgi:hypothetical protein